LGRGYQHPAFHSGERCLKLFVFPMRAVVFIDTVLNFHKSCKHSAKNFYILTTLVADLPWLTFCSICFAHPRAQSQLYKYVISSFYEELYMHGSIFSHHLRIQWRHPTFVLPNLGNKDLISYISTANDPSQEIKH
jgi:hypothetical protein